jgi:hypothetical protein
MLVAAAFNDGRWRSRAADKGALAPCPPFYHAFGMFHGRRRVADLLVVAVPVISADPATETALARVRRILALTPEAA